MLTQIEIDGFKTFKDFKVELTPFQVIVGPNGSGKSNLFDALRWLSRLAEFDLRTAFQEMRGEVGELFTQLPEGKPTDRIGMAVEMLVDPIVRDDFGRKAELTYTRLRYELEIALGTDTYGMERLYVVRESLRSIPREEDNWSSKHRPSALNNWQREYTSNQAVFVDTQSSVGVTESVDTSSQIAEQKLIYLFPDGDEQQRTKRFSAMEAQRTVLSREADTDHPHVFAAREELRSLKFFRLNPEALRQSSSINAPPFLSPEGKNLPTVLARMQAEDKFALTDVSRDMANLVPGLFKMSVQRNQARNEYDIWAETADRQTFSAQVLSDGTLHLLALATLRNDPELHGILCLEEPENGVHPLHLRNMARVLREMATDFNDPQQVDEPLRQLLVTTHSPAFISLPEVIDSLLFAHLVMRGRTDQGNAPLYVTRMVPVIMPGAPTPSKNDRERDRTVEVYTIDMVRKYLSSENLDKAARQLKKARAQTLSEESEHETR